MNFQKTFLYRVRTKALYFTTLMVLAAGATVFLAFTPDFHGSSKAAQEKIAPNPGDEQATPEMLAYALNFKSVAGYQTLAAKSDDIDARTRKELSDTFSAVNQLPCTKIDGSQIGGKIFAPGVYCFDSAELAGQMILNGENDFTAKFVFLARGSFIAKSGSRISLENGAQAANVFFVSGDSMKVEESVELEGNLLAGNDVDVDDASTVKGRMLSVKGEVNGSVQSNLGGGTGSVQICKRVSNAAGTDISNRIYRFTVSGVPGVVEVFVPPTPAGAAVSDGCSAPIDVPVGPQTITELGTARLSTGVGTFEAAPGSFTNFQLINVEQLNPTPPSQSGAPSLGVVNLGTRTAAINVAQANQTGFLILRFTNQFAITGFIEICKQRATGPTLGAETFGFAAQTFNPPAAGTTIPSGGDPDVTGFFNFTVEGVYSLNQINAPGASPAVTRQYQVFPVPVGGCSGPIAVTISNSPPTTTAPRESIVRVTELARPNFFLEAVTTRPFCDREVQDTTNPASTPVVCPFPAAATNQQPFVPGAIPAAPAFPGGGSIANGGEVLGSRVVPPTAIVAAGPNAPRGTVLADNVGGGYATVRVIEASAASETIVDFFNRSNPGVVKVCKIAGPGITVGTIFRFSVFGPFGTTALGTPNSPQFSTYGHVSKIVDIPAGSPETGGTCVLVPGLGAGVGRAEFQTFVNGTPVRVVENGISPLNTVPVAPGAIRVSRVRVFGPAAGTTQLPAGTGAGQAGFSPNPDLTPNPAGFDGRNNANSNPADTPRLARVAFNQRPGETVAEFTNFLFNPTILKICKVAGPGITPNTRAFGFSVTLTNGGPTGMGGALFPGNPTAIVSVIAGPPENNSYSSCAVVNGSAFPGGALNVGSDITITENSGTAGTIVTSIESPTSSGGLTANLAARTARLSGPAGVIPGVTTVAFVNAAGNDPNPPRRTRYDFDGDGKADPSVITPATGTWSYAASSANYQVRSSRWGVATDKPVPADYDGDGKYDLAVFRNGTWYILGSSGGFRAEQFGLATDIPQPGDYDGDGKDDVAVFRPSNGTWYWLGSRSGFGATQFGNSSDRPVAADYDGDGKFDQAVYRSSVGAWYINMSRDGFAGVNWGVVTDKPVPADYNGDLKADIAVFRNGFWYILGLNGSYTSVHWGLATDIPVPADYNGDGRDDVAVYRNGFWYVLTPQGILAIPLGSQSDIPITGTQP